MDKTYNTVNPREVKDANTKHDGGLASVEAAYVTHAKPELDMSYAANLDISE